MKDYGTVRSTVKPEAIVIDDYSVWLSSDIKEVSEKGTDEMPGFKGYQYKLVQYEKDEYIKLLNSQVTETQEAITDIYETMASANSSDTSTSTT